jgi:hypothetical protein
MNINKLLLATALFASPLLHAQEGPVPTQAIVTVDSKTPQALTTQNLTVKVNNHDTELTSVAAVQPNQVQIALLIDDGLRTSVGRQISDIKNFINSLPNGTEILVGYMQNGRVVSAGSFTTDHAAAANKLRLPLGLPGASASPYFSLSDFVKNWPGPAEDNVAGPAQFARSGPKARFVIMITNGVDPYNGSVSILNQNSPYVQTAIRDAQRAGVPVSSIYFSDAGIRGGAASFSGQSYLTQLAEATGGRAYYQGTFNPVSFTPFFEQFQKAIGQSFVATFPAVAKKNDVLPLKVSTSLKSTRLLAPKDIRPGTRIVSGQ